MIINKETLKKIDTIAVKMANLGLGDVETMRKDVIDMYLRKEVKKLQI